MSRLGAKRDLIQHVVRMAVDRADAPAILVEQVMTAQPTCIRSDASVLELAKILHTKGHRHLLVIDEDDLFVGVISDRDIVRCFGPGEYPQPETLAGISAAEIMSTDLITVLPSMPLREAVVLMMENGISCLPVVASGALVGILTTTDLFIALELLLGSLERSTEAEPLMAEARSR